MQKIYESVFRNSVDAIIIIDNKGTIEHANPSTERLFGYTNKELVGGTVNRLMPKNIAKEHDSYISNFIGTGIAKVIGIGRKVQGLTKDKQIINLFLSINEIYIEDERKFIGSLQNIDDLVHAQEELEGLSTRMTEIQEAERNRISQEVHDNLGTSLSLVKLMLQGMVSKLQKDKVDEDDLEQTSADMISIIEDVIHDARSIAHQLSPIGLNKLGLVAAIERLAAHFRSGNIEVTCELGHAESIVNETVKINVYRIVQEALTNIIKHAKASKILITDSKLDNNQYSITISDNGVGMAKTNEPSGLGLLIMRHRIRMVGGEMQINSEKDRGTTIEIIFADAAKKS